ncbi:hypothetical protein [Halorubrum sp. FL23]|uniref:hypothetical protein n=1 Tax=Halorubrum sp. FL23 TaxID=3458704 RepID=UPI004033BF26
MKQNTAAGSKPGNVVEKDHNTIVIGNDTFRFGDRPPQIAPPAERDEQKPGKIVNEVGVLHVTPDGSDYWKVTQRIIETETGIPKTRDGYYVSGGETWNWANGSLELPAKIRRQLDAHAEGAGIKQD